MSPTRFALTGSLVLLLAACGRDVPSPAAGTATPAPAAAPDAVSDAAAYARRCEAEVAAATRILAGLESTAGKASVTSVLAPYNDLLVAVFDGVQEAGLMQNVHPDPDYRAAAADCESAWTSLETRATLSRPLYDAIAAVGLEDADDKTRHFVARSLRDFRLAGVDRDEATRTRIRALDEEITTLGQQFDRNIREDVRSITVGSVADLAGMPADWIADHPPGADGRIRVTTDYPDYIPFMRYADRGDLRRALYVAYQNRAWPANEAVLGSLIEKRWALARLAGFDSWADYATADKMIGNAARAAEFIREGRAGAEPRARADYRQLLERLRRIEPGATEVQPWQASWLENKIKEEKYGLSSEALRPYFEYTRVRDGIFRLSERLFGVRIRPRPGVAAWHEEVEAYELVDGDEIIGRFYLDMHPREGKYKHAAHFYYRAGLAGGRTPESVLVCNFPGGGGKPGYMEKDQVETFLHEFGHLLHYLFRYHQPWLGISQPERDFMEAPSMMLEEWIYDPRTLQDFAVNDAGEPIPAELVAQMDAARHFGQGLFVHRQMMLSAISLSYYDTDPSGLDLETTYRRLVGEYSIFPYVEDTHLYASFGHLNSYSAYYYTYMWSLAIAYDMFTRFQATDLLDPETARAYRMKVLSVGGSRPAAEFVEDFLGRPFGFEAFEMRLNTEN